MTTNEQTQALNEQLGRAQKMLDEIESLPGFMRTINKCGDCGELFGRRFIPLGLGYGASFHMCLCQLTAHRPSQIVLEAKP
jgi:hypothetical protein